MNTTDNKIPVWDLPVRLGHWLLAACFALAWLTGESEGQRLIHVYAGSAMLGIVSFRLLWGVIGSRYARFSDFVRGPKPVVAYLKSLFGRQPQHFTGHNPAGGWAIVMLLALILLAGASGWLHYQELGGKWAEEAHEVIVHLLMAVVVIHLGGVFIGSWCHRENLVRSMLTGMKSGNAADGIKSLRPIAAVLLLVWIAAISWLLGG
ncbi:MAG: cytochrome b/b6 domain-containing protein [Zoogloeaceae bacterium]|nr:cytochrome b/b6 domain-containing protein [Zoogloeaceae bacterium]